MHGAFALVLVVSVVGCGTSAVRVKPAHAVLELAQTTLRAGAASITMGPDGVVREQGRFVGIIHRDGRFVDKSGAVLAVLQVDGTIQDGNGQPVPRVRLHRDGSFAFMGNRISITKDGRIAGVKGGADLRVEVARAAGMRAASFLLVVAVLAAPGAQ